MTTKLHEEDDMTNLHTELYPDLAEIVARIHDADMDLGQNLDDFATQVLPKLSVEERTQLAAILRETAALHTVIDSADREHTAAAADETAADEPVTAPSAPL